MYMKDEYIEKETVRNKTIIGLKWYMWGYCFVSDYMLEIRL